MAPFLALVYDSANVLGLAAYLNSITETNMFSHFLYASACQGHQIHSYGIDAQSGALIALGLTEIPGPAESSHISLPMALSPDKQYLYAGVRVAPFPVATYRIDHANGALLLVGITDFPAPPAYLNVDAGGTTLLSASYIDGKIMNHRIGSDAVVLKGAVQVFEANPKVHSIIFDRSSSAVFAAVLELNRIAQMRLDPVTGLLLDSDPAFVTAHPGAGPRHLVQHPTLNRVYCINETDGTVDTYALDSASGTLAFLQSLSAMPRDRASSDDETAADIHLTPDGRFLYCSERRHSTLAGFSVDPVSGTLSYLGSWETETTPRGFCIHPEGRFLYSAGLNSGHIARHAINPANGHLKLLDRIQAGMNPNWIEVVPAKNYPNQ